MRIPKGDSKLDRKDSLDRIQKEWQQLTGNNILGISPLCKQLKNFGWVFTTTQGQSTSKFPFLRVTFVGKWLGLSIEFFFFNIGMKLHLVYIREFKICDLQVFIFRKKKNKPRYGIYQKRDTRKWGSNNLNTITFLLKEGFLTVPIIWQ